MTGEQMREDRATKTRNVVETAHGRIQVYVQNVEPGARSAVAGDGVTLSFNPDVVFVVE